MSRIRKKLYWIYRRFMLRFSPARIVDLEWKKWKGYTVDWKNPRDINEKIQWLMHKSDTSMWSVCADKYRVRDYVRSKGLEDILVPLLGVWDKAEDIDFESLPDKFAIKCNHDSGSTHIVDKASPDYAPEAIRKDLKKHLKVKYGNVHGEMFYNDIPPRIIAEQKLEASPGHISMTDYKVWCFDGKPYAIWACRDRSKDSVYVNLYNLDWNLRAEASIFTDHYRDGEGRFERPEALDEMLAAAATLSEGFPEVRVDFYDAGGKLYFGELTFASSCGKMDFYTQEFLEELGAQCHLNPRKGSFFVYPRNNSTNPYISNLTKSLEPFYRQINKGPFEDSLPPVLGLLRASFRSDVVVLNWLENIAFDKLSNIQTALAYLSVSIIKARKKKIVWIFHNIQPHKGVNRNSSRLMSLQFRKADLIVAHSRAAADYAKQYADCEVFYRCHPFSKIAYSKVVGVPRVDVLYWGDIHKYKGVDKFVEFIDGKNTGLRVHIMGQCKSKDIDEAIKSHCNAYITYDDTRESFDLIASYISNSKFVVFPYVGESISSSGAVIDTIVLGGNVVGPNRGAFIDLREEGLCHTYDTYDELLQLLQSGITVDSTAVSAFVKENNWRNFGSFIHHCLEKDS